jgi:hypothetical protein
MKALEYGKTKLVIIVLLTAFFSNTVFAQNTVSSLTENLESEFKKNAILSLKMGIENGNSGLKESCIYIAGFYEIEELVEPLVKQLEIIKDPDTKILIALVLYKIGNKEGLEAVEKLMTKDESPKVKKMSAAILNQLKVDQNKKINFSEN